MTPLAPLGVWVLDDTDDIYNVASVVYVGTKLSDDVSATLVAEDGDKDFNGVLSTDMNGNKVFTITLDEDMVRNDLDSLIATATGDVNAL